MIIWQWMIFRTYSTSTQSAWVTRMKHSLLSNSIRSYKMPIVFSSCVHVLLIILQTHTLQGQIQQFGSAFIMQVKSTVLWWTALLQHTAVKLERAQWLIAVIAVCTDGSYTELLLLDGSQENIDNYKTVRMRRAAIKSLSRDVSQAPEFLACLLANEKPLIPVAFGSNTLTD